MVAAPDRRCRGTSPGHSSREHRDMIVFHQVESLACRRHAAVALRGVSGQEVLWSIFFRRAQHPPPVSMDEGSQTRGGPKINIGCLWPLPTPNVRSRAED
jgi:hypothetical protein